MGADAVLLELRVSRALPTKVARRTGPYSTFFPGERSLENMVVYR